MAKFSLLLVLVVTLLVLVLFIEVQGRSRNKTRNISGQGRGRQSDSQSDKAGKSRRFGKKQKDESGKRSPDKHRKPVNGFIISYPPMSPSSFFNFRWNRGVPIEEPWWQGPHVCENSSEEKFNTTGSRNEMMRHFSTNSQVCDESETVYKCKIVQENIDGRKEVTIVYECCHGYTRQKGHSGCPEKVSLLTLIDTAEKLQLTDFVRAVKTMKLGKEFDNGNFTVFVPVNGAFTLDSDLLNSRVSDVFQKDAPEVISVSEPAVEKTLKMFRDALISHVVPGTVKTSKMEDEQLLEAGIKGDTSIRINYFSKPEKLMTANCVPVVSRDNMATNGVIHSVEKVLKPVADNLLEIVKSRQELSTLKTVLAAANYVSKLGQSGQLTLLAPTNSAFDKMNKRLKDKLMSGDRDCLQRVLDNHLLPHVICSVAIQGHARTANQLHRLLNVTRTEDNKLFVNGAQIVQSDIMGTNGVLHLIDLVLVPDEALSALDLIKKAGHSEFLRLVEKAGLTKTLETATNMTIFVPTNEAIQNLHVAVKTKLNEDFKLLKDVVTFHLSPEIQQCRRIHDNHLIPTLAGTSLRLNRYSMFPYHHHGVRTAQCAPIAEVNIEACNGLINVLKAVMMPPKGNVLDTLALDKRFSTLVSLVKKSGIADDLQAEGPFTLIAPSNEAFEKLGQETMTAITKDSDRLLKLIKSHIVTGTLCCAAISRRHWADQSLVTTMSGDQLRLSRDHENRPQIGHALVTSCDQTATNGNVLGIDRVLVHEQSRHRWRLSPFSHWHMPGF